jgi:hypothetical protein
LMYLVLSLRKGRSYSHFYISSNILSFFWEFSENSQLHYWANNHTLILTCWTLDKHSHPASSTTLMSDGFMEACHQRRT